MKRTRAVTQHAAHGGEECPPLAEVDSCNTEACPESIDCEVTSWMVWSPCTKTCGSGESTRTRTITVHPEHGGKACPDLTATTECNSCPCQVDCEEGGWDSWDSCTDSCGVHGVQHRQRRILTFPSEAKTCGTKEITLYHFTFDKHDDGFAFVNHVDENAWDSEGGSYSKTWKYWTLTLAGECRIQEYKGSMAWHVNNNRGTKAFDDVAVYQTAESLSPCTISTKDLLPIDATKFESCRLSLKVTDLDFNGQKKEESDFMCFEVLNNNGKTIANSETCQRDDIKRRRLESYTVLKNSRDKATTEWDADMHLEDHGEDENDVKERQITTKLRNGKENVRIMESADLPAKLLANGIKIKLSAVTNLHAEHWYADDLKVTCRRIVQYAEVVCGKQQHSNKKGCLNPGMKGKTEKHEVRCCSDTAKAGWTKHNDQCPYAESVVPRCFHNKNFAEAEAICAAEGARLCTADELKNDCTGGTGCMHDVDLIWTSTVPTVTVPAGRACGGKTQNQPCNRFACPVDCQVGDWTDFGICSLTCSAHGTKGTETRVRERLVDAGAGGQECPALTETRSCWGGECPIHCEVSAWSEWTTCTKSCTDGEDGVAGRHAHSRTIVRHAAHGGYVCPTLNEDLPCHEHLCPVDCEVGQWSGWAPYHKGGHNLKRTRPVLTPAAHGGVDCPATENLKIFHHQACNKEQTGEWSDCSKSCGTDGRRFRSHEFIKCSEHAALRLHIQYMHKGLCNIKQCETEEEAAQPHAEVYAPEIDSVAAADEMQLVESIGNWVPVTQEDVDAYGLTEQDQMQKFVPSS